MFQVFRLHIVHLEVHSEVFQSIVWFVCFNMLRNKKSLLGSLFCSLGGRGNYLAISHLFDGEFFENSVIMHLI